MDVPADRSSLPHGPHEPVRPGAWALRPRQDCCNAIHSRPLLREENACESVSQGSGSFLVGSVRPGKDELNVQRPVAAVAPCYRLPYINHGPATMSRPFLPRARSFGRGFLRGVPPSLVGGGFVAATSASSGSLALRSLGIPPS